MAGKATPTETVETPEVNSDVKQLQDELKFLRDLFLKQQTPEVKQEEQPKNIVNDFSVKLEKPKAITFTINAFEFDDAKHDGEFIPGKSLIPGFKFIDHLRSNEYGTKYITGFEYDDLQFNTKLSDEDLVEYLKEVRTARQWIERYYNGGCSLDAENKNMWRDRKIKIISLDNIYKAGPDNLENLIVYYNILGGGYPMIARSYEEAKSSLTGQILYMSVEEVEEARKFSHRGALIQAMGKLDEIKNSWKKQDSLSLMYYLPLKKYKGYTVNTPVEHILNELADFIEGIDTKTDKKKRPQIFLDAVDLLKNKGIAGSDKVRVTALFNAADYYNFITYYKTERLYKNRATGFEYGNNKNEAIDKLLSDKNLEELSWLKAKINEKWMS